MRRRHSSVLLTTCVLAACSTFSRGDVQREWNNTFRELGILPIYPPREDVQVGDVMLRRGSATDLQGAYESGFPPIDLYLATAGVNTKVGDHYAARPDFATTPPDWAQSIARVPVKEGGTTLPAAGDRSGRPQDATSPKTPAGMFGEGHVRRLRQVAFPEFSTVTITKGDLSGVLPIKALSLAFAASRASISSVRLKVPNGESCGLPALDVLAAITVKDGDGYPALDPERFPVHVLQALHQQTQEWAKTAPGLGCSARWRIQNDRLVYLDLINEVYYARTFEVSVDRAVDAGVALDIRTIDAAAAQTARSQPQGAAPQQPTPQDPPRLDALQRANALNARLRDSVTDNNGTPRGALSFTSVSEAHVGMLQTYEHPIAIGMRAMTIAVDPATGRIVGGGPSAAHTTAGNATAFLVDALRSNLPDVATATFGDGNTIVLTLGGGSLEAVRAEFSPAGIGDAALRLARAANKADDKTVREIEKFKTTEWILVAKPK
ncbi:MAG: hypothetical protein IPK26_13860 [Planctomycetes bacterium]|nr:hypothetical protein [Planctomycetota bacterium]